MRVLFLQGRGSDTEIFRIQIVGIQSLLEPEYELEFVEGQWPHLRGNWSLHTVDFFKSKNWTTSEPRQIIRDHGPFDRILGYSQGATLAAQLVIRYLVENPFTTVQELRLRLAVLINGATPPCVMPLTPGEPPLADYPREESEEAAHLIKVLKPNETDDKTVLWAPKLANGRKPVYFRARWKRLALHGAVFVRLRWKDRQHHEVHIRGQGDHSDYGEGLLDLCEPSVTEDIRHIHGHDFPRGLEMKKMHCEAHMGTAVD